MFIRKKKNKAGSISIQIISKHHGQYKVEKTIGSSDNLHEIERLYQTAKLFLANIQGHRSLFVSRKDALIDSFISTLANGQLRVIGPELIFGKIYDHIGLGSLKENLFKHLVIARIVYPVSKLKTVDYMHRYQGIEVSVDTIYSFLDKLHSTLKDTVEQIAYQHSLKILGGEISIAFYDMTTLYFETSDEDDLRKMGFSKDGKHQHPQIYLGLLVGLGGYAIGYDIFEGGIYEGDTLIPTIQKFEKKFKLTKPIIVADAGLLSTDNILLLEENGYQYILGGRIKNEKKEIKKQILALSLADGEFATIEKNSNTRLIISYSIKRAAKDEHNRKRGLQRLEKKVKSGKLTKSNINNKGYNKYLKLIGKINVEIDYEKFDNDKKWDGLKGYVTNTTLKPKEIVENYKNLWQIEKAFKISKTDLRIRPIFHHLPRRIEAHLCISFAAYCVYKELERLLYIHKAPFSVTKAAEYTQTMYQINITLPESKQNKNILLQMDDNQKLLKSIIDKIA